MKQIETFGKYLLLERVAAGGMAEVFLAKSTGAVGISKFVAIKRILPQYSDNTEFIDMFKEEARIAMNLSHGNVVAINEFGVESRQFFLVMEYVEGQNLRQILNQLKKEAKDFSIEQCVYIAKQVAAGLDHAHRCIDNTTGKPLNITHRDMSPQNIMISFEGEVKIVDFGIAKAESEMEQTRAGTIKGKFGYMSPEQAEGQVVDARTDIFSLGIVLWELLAKDRLFTANSEAATLRKIRDCQVPSLRRINPSIPPELERIVNKALARDKSLRYQATSAFHRDLNRFLNTQYPEFSAQDFSVFMKTVFAQVYVENRKKQVEFAKISHESKERSLQPVHDEFNTKNDLAPVPALLPGPNNYNGNRNDHEKLQGLDNDEFTSTDNTRIDLTQLKTKSKPLDKFSNSNIPAVVKDKAIPNRPLPRQKQKSEESQPQRASVFKNVAIGGAFFTALVAATFRFGLLPKDLFPNVTIANSGSITSSSEDPGKKNFNTNTESSIPKTTPEISQSDTIKNAPTNPQVTYMIDSNPRGAKVFIDGVDSGATTPVQRQTESGKEFKIGLIKDGYTYFEKIEKITANGSTVRINLQLPPPMGYLTITVVNGGADPVVYINGQRIAQKPPIQFYGVQANTPVTVKVMNPFTQLTAEKTVTVKASEKREINLVLNREALTQ